LATGTYRWLTCAKRLSSTEHLADLDQHLRNYPDLPHLILRLQLEGALPVAAFAELKRRLLDLEAAVFHLDVEHAALATRPTEADLEAIDFDGVLRRCAERLRSVGDDPTRPDLCHRAEEALVELYLRVASRPIKEAA
jgi:hypothetical protein